MANEITKADGLYFKIDRPASKAVVRVEACVLAIETPEIDKSIVADLIRDYYKARDNAQGMEIGIDIYDACILNALHKKNLCYILEEVNKER